MFLEEADGFQVSEWQPARSDPAAVESEIEMLAEVLHAVVLGGAGVSFFVPFSLDDARRFWAENVLPALWQGTRRVLVARRPFPEDGKTRTIGTVQLDLAVPPNQLHRAAVAKLLVHPSARRRGVARALMMAVEDVARAEGRTLLTLDTVTGSAAERLYRSLGYSVAGVIPRYARAALTPDLEDTTVMYKEITAGHRSAATGY